LAALLLSCDTVPDARKNAVYGSCALAASSPPHSLPSSPQVES